MEKMNSPQKGWYPDPEDATQLRYWDGRAWTNRRAPAEHKQRTSERVDLEKIDSFLALAIAAAESGEVAEEHRCVVDAFYFVGREDYSKIVKERVAQLVEAGKLLAGSEYWGTLSRAAATDQEKRKIYDLGPLALFGKALAGGVEVRSDRLLTPVEAFPFDQFTNAQVFLDGQKQVNYQPSAVAGLVGAVLPGTALIPMMAFQVKKVDDTRRAEFVIVGEGWSLNRQIPVKDVNLARTLAERINQRTAATKGASSKQSEQQSANSLNSIEKLAELRDKGLISDAEYETKKTELLDRL